MRPMDDPLVSPGHPGTGDDHADAFEPRIGSFPDPEPGRDRATTINHTGTTTVGLTTAEGVVIATDMRASLGGAFVSSKTVQKVEQIHPTAALTLVGSVGGAQSFIRTLRAEVDLHEARRGREMSVSALATLAGNFARGGPFVAINPILGGVDPDRTTCDNSSAHGSTDDAHHVFTIDPAGGVMEDTYAATGSGLQLAYGVLEREYRDDLSNDEATGIAARAVRSAVERDTGSGNGVYLAEVTGDGVDIHGHRDFSEVL